MTKRLIVKNLTSKKLSGDIILTNKVLKLQLTKNKTPLTHFRFSDELGIICQVFWTTFSEFGRFFDSEKSQEIVIFLSLYIEKITEKSFFIPKFWENFLEPTGLSDFWAVSGNSDHFFRILGIHPKILKF